MIQLEIWHAALIGIAMFGVALGLLLFVRNRD